MRIRRVLPILRPAGIIDPEEFDPPHGCAFRPVAQLVIIRFPFAAPLVNISLKGHDRAGSARIGSADDFDGNELSPALAHRKKPFHGGRLGDAPLCRDPASAAAVFIVAAEFKTEAAGASYDLIRRQGRRVHMPIAAADPPHESFVTLVVKLCEEPVIAKQRLGRNMIIADTVELPAAHKVFRQADRRHELGQDRPILFFIQLEQPHEHLRVSAGTGAGCVGRRHPFGAQGNVCMGLALPAAFQRRHVRVQLFPDHADGFFFGFGAE